MNFINFNKLFHYLIEKNIFRLKDVSLGNVYSFQIQSRNLIHAVLCPGFKDYLVKQVRDSDISYTTTLRQEAIFLQEILHQKSLSFLAEFTPKFYVYDEINHVLITEYYRNSKDVFSIHMQTLNFVPKFGKMQAEVLADLHTKSQKFVEKNKNSENFKKVVPWAFKFHYGPKEWFNLRSGADNYLFQAVQNDEIFKSTIQKLHDEWRQKTLIHGDIKMNNFLVVKDENGEKMKLIDWEIVDFGDPAWDVAGVFQGYLARWAYHYFGSSNSKKEFTSEMLETTMSLFWEEYKNRTSLFGENAEDFLSRTMQFSAVRLIQTCLEASHSDKNLAESNARILQMSQNILRQPIAASENLLGIKI